MKPKLDCHVQWLVQQKKGYEAKWKRLFSSDPEAATCEAVARYILAANVDCVQPADDPGTGGPDFVCFVGKNKFYVEVTCLTVDAVTKATGIQNCQPSGASNFSLLTDTIKYECGSKAAQCANLDAPCLLFLGTFHFWSMSCFERCYLEQCLTGSTEISWLVNPQTGNAATAPVHSTSLNNSVFVRPDGEKRQIEPARKTISGMLIANMALKEPQVNGLLHPDAARPFDPDLLSRIPFGKLTQEYSKGSFSVTWVNMPRPPGPFWRAYYAVVFAIKFNWFKLRHGRNAASPEQFKEAQREIDQMSREEREMRR